MLQEILGNRRWHVVAGAMIALALPLLLTGANLQFMVNGGWLYSYNWWRNGIPEASRIEAAQLDRAARTIKAYFATPQSEVLLDVRVDYQGQRDVPVYREREVLHMRDVKTLVRGFLSAGLWSGVAVLALSAALAFKLRRGFWPYMTRVVRWSAIGTVGAVVIIGAASLINFGAVFTLFHQLGFSNSLWQLDYDDYLLIMFPEQFWFEVTLLLGVLIVVEFAGLYLALRWLRRRYDGRVTET